MADTHETSADIIAEARDKYTVHNCQQCAWRKCCSKGFGSEECGKFRESIFLKLGIEDGYFTQLLDRLEAALKRELGDCAKLREALESLYDQICHGETEQHVAANRQMIRAALAAPPRNCDKVKTSWEVLKEWHEGLDTANDIVRLLDWLLATATEKEGGGK